MAEGNFGTGGAVATAFVCGFQPLKNGINQMKSADNSGWKSKNFSGVTANPKNRKPLVQFI
ncbi:hypothetical protein ACFSQ7_48450 [Paenibacillus rhizoplanae]